MRGKMKIVYFPRSIIYNQREHNDESNFVLTLNTRYLYVGEKGYIGGTKTY